MKCFFTIGHSNHSIDKFFQLLNQHGVTMLADARTYPASRHHPHFNGRALHEQLEVKGITYYYCGTHLGGKRTPHPANYEAALDHLEALAEQHCIALLCAEEDPGHCHRGTLLTPSLLGRGHQVLHIRGTGELQHSKVEPVLEQLTLF